MGLIEIVAIVLLVLWVGGFALHIAGAFIHILLILAVIVFVMRFFKKTA